MLLTETQMDNPSPLAPTLTSSLIQDNNLLYSPLLPRNFSSTTHTIAFVDSQVADTTTLMMALNTDVKVILDPTRDGIAQITETLSHYKDLTGIEIISHGNDARLQLGDSFLGATSLQHYAPQLQQWATSFVTGADILLYGCDVAQDDLGKSFVQQISNLTGTDVAASTDLTGNAKLGGNWTLEYTTGSIETANPLTDSLINSYQGVLATLFTTQTPAQTNFTDGTGVDWEYGMKFTSTQSGQITAIRYYKSPSETGSHIGRIWSSTGQQLANVTFANETASGWQQQALTIPVTIAANTTYVVSVNTNGYYAVTSNGFAAPITNGRLTAPVGAGVYNETNGVFPNQIYQNENYFRDVDFTPSSTSNTPGSISIAGTSTQNQILTANVTDVDGLPATINYQWQQSSNGTTWSNITGANAKTLTLQQAQVGQRVRAIASYTDLLSTNETVNSNPTNAVVNVNDIGVVAIGGTPIQGQILTANVTDIDGLPATINYQWQQSTNGTTWSNITGATAKTLTLQASQVGRQVRARATYTDALGTLESNRTSPATALITTANNNLGTVSISGTVRQNEILTATVADTDGLPATINYQWEQSSNGTTWSNVAGATARTLTLQQAQVGQQVRARATYVDLVGNSETISSNPTSSPVVNVNDIGVVAIGGTTTQGQTLTANVTDIDGLPATINYQWRQRNNDTSPWIDISGATAKTLTLQQAQVGKQVQVNAIYIDALQGNENIFSLVSNSILPLSASSQSIFTTQTPSQTNFTDGAGVDWEYGMKFTSDNPGLIQAIRYYKSPSETGIHVGRIWSSTGQSLANVTFANETASGWQQQALTTPLSIEAGVIYVVSVNTNGYYAVTPNGFDTSIISGGLTAPISAGVYNENPGSFPTLVYSNENYFRDVVFTSGSSVALRDNATIFVSETAGTATVTVTRTGNTQERMTLEYTTNEIGGAGAAQAGADYTQPSFDGRANTGQVVFEIGDTVRTFTVPIVNDSQEEGNESFAIGLQNPSSGSLGAPRTVLITIVDDDSPANISMSSAEVTVSEGVSTANITIQRSGNINGASSVNFTTSNGTAIAGSDYTATSGTVNFAVGQLTQTISIPILNDIITENDETFTVTLSNPTNAILGNQLTSAVTILDNDLNLGTLVRQTFVSGLSEPTTIDWTPDGRYMFVAQQNGVVRLVDNGTLRSTPLIDLSNQVNYTPGDRGLLGLAVHPNFASTPYIYLLYTYDPPETAGGTGLAGPDTQGNRPSRLVRLTVNPTTMVADPASLLVLAGTNSTWAYTSRPDVNSNGNVNIPPSGIVNGSNNVFNNGFGTTTTVPGSQIDVGTQDNDPNSAGTQNQNIRDYLASDGDSHSNGAVHFGADGWLYLTNGDGTSYNFADPRSVRVQDINNLSGKVLRIDPITGAGVPGNPFFDVNNPNSNRSKVFYSGIRNAYRFTFDPITNLPVIGDVGWTSWEEINTGAPGSNFGWPYLEGPNRTGQYQNLPQAISFYNNGNRNNPGDQTAVFPILSRSHGSPDNASAITVGDFYNSNTLMFGDVVSGTLYAATLNSSRQVTNVQVFDSNIPYIVDMEMGPDGRLYGVDLVTGSILRWNPAN
jgi:glucose/arabinose dehydrogenase